MCYIGELKMTSETKKFLCLKIEYRIMPPAAVVNAMYNHTNQELKKMTFELHIKESMMSFFRLVS